MQLRALLLFEIQISVPCRLYLWVATSIVSCRILSVSQTQPLSPVRELEGTLVKRNLLLVWLCFAVSHQGLSLPCSACVLWCNPTWPSLLSAQQR